MVYLKKSEKIKHKKNSTSSFLYIILIASLIPIIIFPKQVSSGIKNGIDCCLNTLIPSMFPFMIISSMILVIGYSQNQKSLSAKIFKSLFYLPIYVLPVMLMSLFGGYPIGAYCTKHLYRNKQINEEQLNRIMTFCVNSGPAFIISVLGESLLKSPNIGLKLFSIQIVSTIIIGIFGGIFAKIKKYPLYQNNNSSGNSDFTFSSALIDSCHNTCHSLINMCSLVTLFFGITSLLNELHISTYISPMLKNTPLSPFFTNVFISSLLEMTQACLTAYKNPSCPYALYSWIIGFGGLCAHTQIIAELKNCPFKYRKFLTARIINGILTALITSATIKNQNISMQASSNLQQSFKISTSTPTYFGSITLLIFCVLFTFNTHLPFHPYFKSNSKNL